MKQGRHAAPRKGATTEGVLLAWGLDRDGRKASVTALDAASRRARAPFTCVGCGEVLVAKLGAVRARHFAHRPGSACALTRPETALHLDAKERLLALCADAFSGARRVRLLARCPGCRRETPLDLGTTGDAAHDEAPLGALRVDVLVSRRGLPALALEVRVTHAVDAAKEAALAAAGVPALEVDAREEWLREEPGAADVLPARGLGIPRCGPCLSGDRAERGRAAGGEESKIAELEAYRARGLLGPPPGPPLPVPPVIGEAELAALRFACPECGGTAVALGERLATHACQGAAGRPVAWRGYDGALVALRWWRPAPARALR
jgi:hypothetical protein